MFLSAILFILIGFEIFRGKTDLIHDYHQTKVKDKVGYGKAMGKAISGIGVSALISAIISLIPYNSQDQIAFIATDIFVIGFIVSFILIFKAQKKYNGGIV